MLMFGTQTIEPSLTLKTYFIYRKGKLQSKKVKLKRKSMENEKKMSHHWHQCAKWFSRYPIPKSAIWARWTSPFCRFLASFSLKYDITDAILQDIEKNESAISQEYFVQHLKSGEIPLLTSNSLQSFKQIEQKTPEILHFHFFHYFTGLRLWRHI